MKFKKRYVWILGVPAALFLIAVVLWNKPGYEGISRAAVYKAAALFSAGAEEWGKEEEKEKSRFPAVVQGQWYVKYGDYLYRHQMLSEEMTPPDGETAEGLLTCGEAAYLLEKMVQTLKESGDVAGEEGENLRERILEQTDMDGKNKNKPFPANLWWSLYKEICEICGEGAEEKVLQIYGTPSNLKEAKPWTALTDDGIYGFEGLGLDSCLDCRVRVLVNGREILHVEEILSREIVCPNVWITDGGENEISGYVGGFIRTFSAERKISLWEETVKQLADVYLSEGEIEKVVLKKERITARVLAVKDDAIELEGYGEVALDKNFSVYKMYGQFEKGDMSQILVGYDTQEFAVAGGKLCAAFIVRTFDAGTIRVLLMDTGFHSVLHDRVEVEFLSDGLMIQGEQETVFHKGETMAFQSGDALLADGRVVLKPGNENGGIRILSLERGSGTHPVYPGKLEISQAEGGIGVVNDLYLEDYLKRVVPSEMPAGYEKEALKAQAVCARTYAYRQIRSNTYKEYGAHVDDSTRFQVYNNSGREDETDAAVNETYGEFLMYEENVADVYYFSTSCGHTASVAAWGEDLSKTPYLDGKAVREGGGKLNLTDNEAFEAFIKGNPEGFESGFGMYRWTTEITGTLLQEKMPGLGKITAVTVAEREEGGIGTALVIEGTEGSRRIEGEGQIRSVLGSGSLEIRRQDGMVLTGWPSLPSAFIAIEGSLPEEGQTAVFHIYGGGYGHGIGMSQNGAQAMAEKGWDYREILEFFYEGTRIEGLPAPSSVSSMALARAKL